MVATHIAIFCFSSSSFSTTVIGESRGIAQIAGIAFGRDFLLRKIPRIILPERVFGSESVQCSTSGVASGPISLRTHSCAPSAYNGDGSSPLRRHKRKSLRPLIACGIPTTAASARSSDAPPALTRFPPYQTVDGRRLTRQPRDPW